MERPEIVILESFCAQWGRCWSAAGRYYSGHYKTRQQAVDAANAARERMRPRRRRVTQQLSVNSEEGK